MVTKNHYRWDFIGLSTDEKPTAETSEKVANGSTYYCSDTSKLYVWYQGTWYEKTIQGGGGGGSETKTLSTADYNWPTENPTAIAGWLLPPDYYVVNGENVLIKRLPNENHTLAYDTGDIFIKISPAGEPTELNPPLYIFTQQKNHEFAWFTGNETTSKILTLGDVVNNLTTDNALVPLSAAQGKVLKDTIDALPTGGITELTTADYNYPTNNPTSVALWLLEPGIYKVSQSGVTARPNTTTAWSTNQGILFIDHIAGNITSIFMLDNANKAIYVDRADTTTGVAYGTETYFLPNSDIVTSSGSSNTKVMSQNATTSMVFADPSTRQKIQIGSNASYSGIGDKTMIGVQAYCGAGQHTIAIGSGAQSYGTTASPAGDAIAIGYHAEAKAYNAVAIGAGSSAIQKGQMDIGTSRGAQASGYNNSEYRLLTGLYDPQSAHDAANKEYVDTANSYSTTEVATGGTWVDGSTIYKKTISFGALPNSSSKTVAHGITNLSRVVKFECVGYRSTDSDNFPIPLTFSGTDVIRPLVTPTNIDIETTAGRSSIDEVYVTLYYTKSA